MAMTPRGGNKKYNYSGQSAKPNMETDKSVAVTLNQIQQDNVKSLLSCDLIWCPISQLRNRYTVLDLAYYMEKITIPQYQREVSENIQELYRNMELPILQPNINAAHAYLAGIFTTGLPMFGVVTDSPDENQRKAARQLEAIIAENAEATGWSRQVSLSLKDGLKYNIAATEIDWFQRQIFQPMTNIATPGATRSYSDIQKVLRGGNEMKSMDMYNTFFDFSVRHYADIHIRGDFAGYCERLTLAQCYQEMADLKQFGGVTMNHDERLWKSMPFRNWHWIPRILTDQALVDPGRDWGNWFNWNTQPMQYGTTNTYEKMVYYRRIIPSMLDINHVPDPHSVQVWKFVEINGFIVYAERRTNAHNFLPIVFQQPYEDNLGSQAKGLGETLLNFQNLEGTLFRARLAALSRSISDRGIFDPSIISTADINSRNPAAKIPARPKAYGTDLRNAYFPIPFNDNTAGTIWQEIGQVDQKAADAANINRAQRGQFTKGNRTMREFDEVMSNGYATQEQIAISLESQVFMPMKQMVKLNTLQYQSSANIQNPNTKEVVEINPAELRQASLSFKLADGLNPKDKIMNIGETLEAFQIMAQAMQFQIQSGNPNMPVYDLVGMVAKSLEDRGVPLATYKIPHVPTGGPVANAADPTVPNNPAPAPAPETA